MYRTIPVKAKFTGVEQAFWIDQCQHANSLINCAIYHTRQTHYSKLEESDNAFTTYWRGDDLRHGWKTYKCSTSYPQLDLVLKDNVHYKALAAQAAQQTLKTVGESITQRKRNLQMRDAINKAARFIINRCLNDRVGNLVIGWNEGHSYWF